MGVTSNAITDLNLLYRTVYESTSLESSCSAMKDASEKVTGMEYVSSNDVEKYFACVLARPSRALLPTIITSGGESPSPIISLTSFTTRELMPPQRPLSEEMARRSDDSAGSSSSLGL